MVGNDIIWGAVGDRARAGCVPSQRRILRSFGAEYTYLVGEVVDVGDETAVVEEG